MGLLSASGVVLPVAQLIREFSLILVLNWVLGNGVLIVVNVGQLVNYSMSVFRIPLFVKQLFLLNGISFSGGDGIVVQLLAGLQFPI